MAAVVEICEANGVGETISHNIANINFGSNDSSALTPATYPITVGQNSFLKYVRIHWTSGTANKLDNFRVWKSAGAYVTGEGIQCNLETSAYSEEAYATPVATTYTHNTMPVADPGAPNIGIGGSLSGSLTAGGAIGDTTASDYIKMQLQTTGSSPAGNVNQKTFTFQYDEQ
jgi:hypothetical protein